jgi:hypothetical protein
VGHDEITTKIEIPATKPDNIVRVDFIQAQANRKAKQAAQAAYSASVIKRSSLFPRMRDIDLTAPWVLRLVAVLAVLILSMLIL